MGIPTDFIGKTQLGQIEDVTSSQLAATRSYLSELTAAARELVPPTITYQMPTGTAPSLGDIQGNRPDAEISMGSIEVPGVQLPAGDFTALNVDYNIETPPFYAVSVPDFDMGAIPAAPAVQDVGVGAAPAVQLPPAPELLTLNIQAFNGVTIPAFEGGDLPTVTLVEPSVTPYVPGDQYTSALLTSLKTELERRITLGGSGLNADVEQAIYDRAREREVKALQDAIDGLERMETMGFAMPPGVYLDSRLKIETEFGKTQAGLSRDIMVKQAELELANVQDALKVATQLEAQLLDYTSKIEQRMFETAKYTTEAGVQVYNAKVEAYKAQLEAYRTKVTIYEAVIRGEIAKVEAYRAQVAAEQAKAEINTARVNQYKVAADVALSNIEIYRVQVQAAQIAAQIEQTRVAMYGESVRAYAAKATAYGATMEGYKVRAQVEGLKQDAFRAQVEAYKARVEAAAEQAKVHIEQLRAQVLISTSQYEGVKAQAAVLSAQAQAQAAALSAQADIYQADAQAAASKNEVEVKRYEAEIRQAQGAAEVAIAQARMTGELSISSRQLILEASKVAAQVSAQLGAAALNAFNWSNSISSSESFAWSNSNSTSTSTNTNYNL